MTVQSIFITLSLLFSITSVVLSQFFQLWNMDLMNNVDNRLYNRLVSQGYGEVHARAMTAAQNTLIDGTSLLARLKPEPFGHDFVQIGVFGDHPEDLILNTIGAGLLSSWRMFADALSSIETSRHGYIDLVLKQVRLDEEVLDMLIESFKTSPLRCLLLMNNGLEGDGMKSFIRAIKTSSTLEILRLCGNRIESTQDATSLIEAVINHPTVDVLHLERCAIGRNDSVMSAIVPSLYAGVDEVRLTGNCIGLHGATLISNCLGSNPGIRVLHLDDNLLNDAHVEMLATSLKTNTRLRLLGLKGNALTRVGKHKLQMLAVNHSVHQSSRVQFISRLLNAFHDSNHTCRVDVDEEGLLNINCYEDPKLNRARKIVCAISHEGAHLVGSPTLVVEGFELPLNVSDIPVGIMPRVLSFLQKEGRFLVGGEFNALFLFIREWNMPLLYTNSIGTELRRSERIRKKEIIKLMKK